MKKTLYILVLLLVIFCVLGCKSTKKEIETQAEVLEVTVNEKEQLLIVKPVEILIDNHSYLGEINIGEEIVVVGVLSKEVDNFVLIENPLSKNRVSFLLEFDEKLETQLLENLEKEVKITGVFKNSISPWNKEMTVIKIETDFLNRKIMENVYGL